MTAQTLTQQVRHAWFVELFFVSETKRVWSGYRYLEINGQVWAPVGPRGVVEQIEDPIGDQAPSLSLKMSGVDTDALAIALSETNELRGRMAFIYDCYFDADWQPIDQLETYAIAKMDTIKVSKAQNPDGSYDRVIEVPAEYLLTTGANPPNGRYSSSDQQARYPGQTDRYFEFIGSLQNKRLRWPDF